MDINIPAIKAMLRRAARCPQCGRDASKNMPGHRQCDGCGAPAVAVMGRLFGEPVTTAAWDLMDKELQDLVIKNSMYADDIFGFSVIRPSSIWGNVL